MTDKRTDTGVSPAGTGETGSRGAGLLRDLAADFTFQDARGTLVQLVHEGFGQINVLTSGQGVVRGGHYHQDRTEAFYLISGSVVVRAWNKTQREERLFRKNDFFEIPPLVAHSMYFPEDCTMVQMYDRCVENPDGTKDIWPAKEPAWP